MYGHGFVHNWIINNAGGVITTVQSAAVILIHVNVLGCEMTS